ncbi:MAG: stalk domain-containing protein [Symbiobacteriia bacterium]
MSLSRKLSRGLAVGLCAALLLGAAAPTALATVPSSPAGWRSPETLDGAVSWGAMDIAVDRLGYPHILRWTLAQYGQGHALAYAYKDSTGWHPEPIHESSASYGIGSAHLALDPSGAPHVCYFAGENDDLIHAWRDGTGWHEETVDSYGQVGVYNDIAVDAQGRIHIVYYDLSHGHPKYALKSGGKWMIEVIDTSTADTGQYLSLALDASDNPHVAYHADFLDGKAGHLRYAYRDASGWHTNPFVDLGGASGYVGKYTQIALGPDGRAYIAYTDYRYERWRGDVVIYGQMPQKFAYQDTAGKWQTEFVDFGDQKNVNGDTLCNFAAGGLHVDSQGVVSLVYSDATLGGRTKYARRGPAGWEPAVILAGGGTEGRPYPAAWDASGYAHVIYETYVDVGGGQTRVAYSTQQPITLTPAAPSGLKAVADGSTVNLTWQDLSGNEAGFEIQRFVGPSGIFLTVARAPAGTISYADRDLALGTYNYRVRAYAKLSSLIFNSNFTGPATVTVLPPALSGTINAPTGLAAVVLSNSEIRLSWQDNCSLESGYRIERKMGLGSWTELATLGSDVTGYTDSGLAAGTAYSYRLRAFVKVLALYRWSDYSNTASATPVVVLGPPQPTGLTAKIASATSVALAWTDNSGGKAGFQVESSVAGGAWSRIATLAAGVTSYANTGLTTGTNYRYRVRAYKSVLALVIYSGWSNEATVTPILVIRLAPSAPAAPAGLSVTGTAATNISLAWQDNSGNETGFQVERRQAGGPFVLAAELGAGTRAWSDAGLLAATTYTYRVRAVRTAGGVTGYSDYSGEVQATTDQVSPPAAPTDLTAMAGEKLAVNLTWRDNSTSEAGFSIERKTAGGTGADSDFTQIATVSAGVTGFIDEGTAPATAYTYRVQAYHAYGASGYSNTADATTPEAPAGAPQGQTVVRLYIGQADYFVGDEPRTLDAAPQLMENRTVVPIRVIIEALGGQVQWDPAASKVTATLGKNTVEVWLGKPAGRVNGVDTPIDPANPKVVPVLLPPGRTFLPLRFVAENLDCGVGWDQDLQQVTVTYPKG